MERRWKELHDELVELIIDHLEGEVDDVEEWKFRFTNKARSFTELSEALGKHEAVTFPDGDMAGIVYVQYQSGELMLSENYSVPFYREYADYYLWDEEDYRIYLEENQN